MSQTTTREEFRSLLNSSKVVSVCREIFADSDTPASIFRKVAASKTGSFLLESADQSGAWARYSFVGAGSFGTLSEKNGFAAWNVEEGSPLTTDVLLDEPLNKLKPLEALEKIYNYWGSEPQKGLPPLSKGLVGFISWDAVQEIYGLQTDELSHIAVPAQHLSFVSELVVIDHHEGVVLLIANVLNNDLKLLDDEQQEKAWLDAQDRLTKLQEQLASAVSSPLAVFETGAETEVKNVTPKEKFLETVLQAQNYIAKNEASQIVVSQRFDLECEASPLDVYRVLRHKNPSPFLYLLNARDKNGDSLGVVGSSPEALITIKNNNIITHPIAGSKPRGATHAEDQQYERELLSDKKEVAEHKMLVELSKSDLAEICDPETITVEGYMRVERFSHVMHIVSTVQGSLAAGKNPLTALRATFPAGTLSGSPKKRALEIIDELEPVDRGVFGGVVGYVDFSGSADLAIAIRTAVIQNGIASVQAGAGIVADSVAESESLETRNKAAAPIAAIRVANAMREV